MDRHLCPAKNDPRRFSRHQTGRQSLHSGQSVQGRRAPDPLHQQQPGETGHTSSGQAGGRNHTASSRTTAGSLLGKEKLALGAFSWIDPTDQTDEYQKLFFCHFVN